MRKCCPLDTTLKKSTNAAHKSAHLTSKKRASFALMDGEDESEETQYVEELNEVDDALSDEYDEKKENKKNKLLDALNGTNIGKQASINLYSYEFESIMKGSKGD